MLLELFIKNFALIEEVRIEYSRDLNIITGETGSGKSIMIDALSFALGKKAQKTVIRTGESKAIIEAVFFVQNIAVLNSLNELGIDVEENIVTIAREISSDGRSLSRVNGRTVNQSDLKSITSQIVTIHGQNEYDQILTSSNQLRLIDSFGDEIIGEKLSEYRNIYEEYLSIENEKLKLNDEMDDASLERELDLLSYEIEEIKNAQIRKEEREEIKEKLLFLENEEKIKESIQYVTDSIYNNKGSVLDILQKCVNKLENISEYMPESEEWINTINDAYYSLEDTIGEIRHNKTDFEDENNSDIEELNARLEKINQIYRKYGKDYEEVMLYLKKSQEKKERIISKEQLNKEFDQKLELLEQKLEKSAEEITILRKKISQKLEKSIKEQLDSLNMKNVQFEIKYTKVKKNKNGADHTDFYISFNKGEEPKPISQIASGGEISRFMLAFKTVVASTDNIDTLIFDEIDTGVSGIAAQKIGTKLKDISKFRQVVCITHLPQIASFADTHFVVEKQQSKDKTHTVVEKTDSEKRVYEIAKMISGADVTPTALTAAKELIEKNSGAI